MTTSDMHLVQEYATHQSESAFAELVSRHTNLVYSVAMRLVGNQQLAEEITQVVFIVLARKAASLGANTILTGWLYRTTCYVSGSALKRERRRQHREQEAYMQSEMDTHSTTAWNQLSPLLDDAMLRLSQTDRDALVLRYFEGRTLQEVGVALGASEDAAKKRVGRALEKLRNFFAKQGVHSTTAAIAETISANSIQAAPLALAKTVTVAALAKGATASTSTLTLIKGALKTMAWTKTQTAVIAGVIILCAIGVTKITSIKIAEHQPQPWQKAYNPSLLDTLPPQVRVLPSPPSTMRSSALDVWGSHNGKVLGLGQSVADLLLVAYQVHASRLIWQTSVPPGKYDFIANLNSPMGNILAAQKLFQEKFGLSVQSELINTNVYILTAQTRSTPGLHPSPGIVFSDNEQADSFSSHGRSTWVFIDYVEHHLGTILMDETGLTDNYDIDFRWNGTPEGLKRALHDQLGLELTPTNMPVEMLVIDKTK